MRKLYISILFIASYFFSQGQANAPYLLSGPTDGLGQYGYLEKDAPTFIAGISNSYGNIYQLFFRTFLNGNNILTYGNAVNTCAIAIQTTGNYNFGANAIAGQIAYTSVHADYCNGGGNSYSNNPNNQGFNEREHYIFDVSDRPSDLSSKIYYTTPTAGSSLNVVMSLKIDFGALSNRILNRFWIQNTGTLLEGTDIANDGFKIYYEPATGSEVFNGTESFGTLYGGYNSNPLNNNEYGNDALGIPVPAGGLRVYVVLNNFSSCFTSGKTVSVKTINDAFSFLPNSNSYTLARVLPTPTVSPAIPTSFLGAAGNWIGVNSNWNDPANWPSCAGGVPSNTASVIIPKGVANYPVIGNTEVASITGLDMEAGAKVTVQGTGQFNLYGLMNDNVGYNGLFDAKDGTLNLTATIQNSGLPLSITGTHFVDKSIKNLIISTSSILKNTLNDTLKLTGKISFVGSSNQFNTNGNLTLVSDAAGTASVGDLTNANLNSGNTIVGDVNVERYIETNRKWRYLSINVEGTAQSVQNSWMEGQAPGANAGQACRGIWITDPTGIANGFDATSFTASMKYWTGSTYTDIPSTSYNIKNQSAYMVYIRGDRSATGANTSISPTTLRTRGTLIQNQFMPLSVPPVPVGTLSYRAFSNPYASAIDLTKLNYSSGGGGFTIAVWDPKATGSYGLGRFQYLSSATGNSDFTIFPGGGSYPVVNIANPIQVVNTIESGQGFFMQASTVLRTVSFPERCKTPKARDVFFTSSNPQIVNAMLSVKNSNELILVDGIQSNIASNYNSTVDYEDARKLQNTGENVSIKIDNNLIAIERRGLLKVEDTIAINMTNLRVKDYQWSLDLNNLDEPGRVGFLIDKFLNTKKALNLNGSTLVDFSVTSTAGSCAADRFMIVFKQNTIPAAAVTLVAARNANKTVDVKWTTANEAYIEKYEIETSANGSSFTILTSKAVRGNDGTAVCYMHEDATATTSSTHYRIKATLRNGTIIYSNIVKLAAIVEKEYISAYPNPVKGNNITLEFANKLTGFYNVKIVDKLGKLLYNNKLEINSNLEKKVIQFTNNLAAGSYNLVVYNDAGVLVASETIIK
jgi:hypothetical protein